MIHTESQMQEINAVTGFTCDCCNKHVPVDNIIETQEKLGINFTGGYGSVFGDGAKVECDLCQRCLKSLLGKYLRIS